VLADNFGNGLSSFFPLYVKEQGLFGGAEPRTNLSDEARAYLRALAGVEEVSGKLAADLFYHALAVLHAPAYRLENAGALRQDWPRVPLAASLEALRTSAALGRRVTALLDPEAEVPGVTHGEIRPELRPVAVVSHAEGRSLDPGANHLAVTAGWGYEGRAGITMPGQGHLEAAEDAPAALSPAYDVYLNDVAYWAKVPAGVWEYTLGGYPVLKKWLSYRERRVLGRDLTPEEARAFTRIARRIAALLALEEALDANYRRVRA
jgi:hypothetical protein